MPQNPKSVAELDDPGHLAHLVHTFRVADLAGHERIVYRYQHEEYGRFEHEFALDGHEPVRIVQWVLP